MEKKKKVLPTAAIIAIVLGVIILAAGIMVFVFGGYSIGAGELEAIEQSYDADGITKLDLNFAVGKFEVAAEDTDKIKVTGINIPKDTYSIEASGGTFRVRSKNIKWYESPSFSITGKGRDTDIKIVIPRKNYAEADIDCGVGDCRFSGITADKVDLDGGVGNIEMSGCSFGKTNIDAGVGELNFQGVFLDDTNIEMGVGAAKFDIDGYRNDYNLEKSKKIFVDYSDNGSERDGRIDIDVSTGVGEAKFKFR